jgi:hypothetical protein
MSTTEWRDPNTGEPYDIGTEGLEHGRKGISGFILEIFRKTYLSLHPAPSILGTLLFGGSVDAAVPTYGLWAGPGYAGGTRPTSNPEIKWEQPPCMNDSITKPDANPDECYSLVDAITKTHDWRYVRPLKSIHMLRCAAVLGVAAYTKSTPHFSDFARLASERI